jgi:torsin-1
LDFRKSIFLFLTNAAGPEIAEKLYNLSTKDGKFREETKLNDFERICEMGAYNKEGGLQNSGPIEAGLIDHFIPFLPLEQRHVEKCIRAEFHRLYLVPSNDQIAQVMRTVTYDGKFQFASYGCKRLDKKVHLEAQKQHNRL